MKKSENPSAVRSRKEITEALLKLMEKYPYSEITVKQIILETTLVRKTFYRNFDSKDDVIDSYISDILSKYVKAVTVSESEIPSLIFEFCIRYKDFLILLHKNNMLYLLLLKLNSYIPAAHIEISDIENPFSKCFGDLNFDYLIAFNIGAAWNVISKWVERGMSDSPEQIIGALKSYFNKIADLKYNV